MSTNYSLYCPCHKVQSTDIIQSAGGIGRSKESIDEGHIEYFIVLHSTCGIEVISEHDDNKRTVPIDPDILGT